MAESEKATQKKLRKQHGEAVPSIADLLFEQLGAAELSDEATDEERKHAFNLAAGELDRVLRGEVQPEVELKYREHFGVWQHDQKPKAERA